MSQMACMVNRISENLLKLCANAVKTVAEWCNHAGLLWDCSSKLEEFHDLPEGAADHSSQKFLIGLKLMTPIQMMH